MTAQKKLQSKLAAMTDDMLIEIIGAMYAKIDYRNPECEEASIVARYAETELATRIGWEAVEIVTDAAMEAAA